MTPSVRKLQASAQKLQWKRQKRGLDESAQSFYGAAAFGANCETDQMRPADRGQATPDAAQAAGAAAAGAHSPPEGEPPTKRAHRRTVPELKNLPAGYQAGRTDFLSASDSTRGRKGVRVVWPPAPDGGLPGNARFYDSLKGTSLPDGNKTHRFTKQWTAKEHLYAVEYSRQNSYTKAGGALPPLRRPLRPAGSRPPPHTSPGDSLRQASKIQTPS